MGLLQRDVAMTDEVRIMTRSIDRGLQAGQVFKVIGISKETPKADWIDTMSMPYSGPMSPSMHIVDCAGDRDLRRAIDDLAKPPPPDPLLDPHGIGLRYGWGPELDVELYYTAKRGHGFPAPISWNATSNLLYPGTPVWQTSTLDAWDREMLGKLEMLQRFMKRRIG